MQMNQLITGARRAATWTLQSGYHTKRTLGEKLVLWIRRIEEKEQDCSGSNCQPGGCSNRELPSSITSDMHKVKIRHDPTVTRGRVFFMWVRARQGLGKCF